MNHFQWSRTFFCFFYQKAPQMRGFVLFPWPSGDIKLSDVVTRYLREILGATHLCGVKLFPTICDKAPFVFLSFSYQFSYHLPRIDSTRRACAGANLLISLTLKTQETPFDIAV